MKVQAVSTIDEKNPINLKETSKTNNNNMASKNFLAIDSIGFHGSKLVPDREESKIHFLLPFPYEDEVLPTQAAVSATTTTITIDSTNNANTNNNTASNTNSILIQSSATTTATINRADNKNKNNNVVNDSDNS